MHYIMCYLMPETSFQKSTKEIKSDVISNNKANTLYVTGFAKTAPMAQELKSN